MLQKVLKVLKKLAKEIWANNVPSFIWPGMITVYALFERAMAGFGVQKFVELTTHSNNIIPELLFISLGGSVGLKWVKNRAAAVESAQVRGEVGAL